MLIPSAGARMAAARSTRNPKDEMRGRLPFDGMVLREFNVLDDM